MGVREWIILVAMAAAFGSSFVFVEMGLDGFAPFTVVMLRLALAAAALHVIARALGHAPPRDPRLWRAYAVMGFLNNALPFSLFALGQQHITAGQAAILAATTPLVTAVLAHVTTHDERLTRHRVAGVLVGLAGVAVLVGPTAFAGLDASLWAYGAVTLAASCYAVASLYGRRFKAQAPITTAAGQVTMGALWIAPFALALDRPWTSLPMDATPWLAVLGLALIGTTVAYLLYFRLLATAGANNTVLVTLLVPVAAAALGALLLGESLTLREAAGMGLIATGLLTADGRALGWIGRAGRSGRTNDGPAGAASPAEISSD